MNRINTIPEAINYIGRTIDYRDGLEQLAEEASELSQAALKMIRAAKLNDNPTPVSEIDAGNNLIGEIEDVVNACYVLGFTIPDPAESEKFIRWANRLKGNEK